MKIRIAITAFLLMAMAFSMPALADSAQVEQLLAEARGQLGTPYALRSNAPESFNCLTYIFYCFDQVESGKVSMHGIDGEYERIASLRNVEPGDIVCFKSSNKKKGILGYHFGISVGGGRFIHASSAEGKVTVSSLNSYRKRFIGALRVF